jgi:hypothetical protein
MRNFPVWLANSTQTTSRPRSLLLGCWCVWTQTENTVQNSHQRELLKQLDQLSEQIREHEHEETRAKIDELFQRVKMPGQNDNGAWIEST